MTARRDVRPQNRSPCSLAVRRTPNEPACRLRVLFCEAFHSIYHQLNPPASMVSFVFIIFLALFLLPIPSPALPTRQLAPTRIDVDLLFGTAFSSAFLFAVLGSFAWLVTGRSITQLFESLYRMASTLITFAQRLADFPYSSLVERAITFLNVTGVNRPITPRRRGPAAPVATVDRGRVQSRWQGRLGGAQGVGGPSTFALPT